MVYINIVFELEHINKIDVFFNSTSPLKSKRIHNKNKIASTKY